MEAYNALVHVLLPLDVYIMHEVPNVLMLCTEIGLHSSGMPGLLTVDILLC